MLEKIIKELTTTNDDDQITSEGMLAWAKRVEMQRAQTAVLNTTMESRQFDKVKVEKKRQHKTSTRSNITAMTMPILWQIIHTKAVSGIQKDVCRWWQNQTFQNSVPKQKRPGG